MHDTIRFSVNLVDAEEFEGIVEGAIFWRLSSKKTGGVIDDFGGVTEEKKSLIMELTQRKLGFPVEWTGIVVPIVEIVARAAVILLSLGLPVKGDADVVVDDYIFPLANDFRPFEEGIGRLTMTQDQVPDRTALELQCDGGRPGGAAGDAERSEWAPQESEDGVRVDKVIQEPSHFEIVGPFLVWRKRLGITRRNALDAAKFRALGKGVCFPIGGEKHFLKANAHLPSSFSTDLHHGLDVFDPPSRRLLNPDVGPRLHTIDRQGRIERESSGVIAGDDENHIELFGRQHLVVIGIALARSINSGARLGPLTLQITDSDEVDRRIGESGINITEGMATGPNETGP